MMEDDETRTGEAGRSHAPLLPRAARQRSRRRSLEKAIQIVEEGNLTTEEQKQVAKLRRLLNDVDFPEADARA
jgi:hypothetical protein